jgi:ureidoacrylate peracid hydrolase
MHKVDIPQSIIERGRRLRGGREHIFDSLDMSKVAHVVVDLQVGFCAEGAAVEVPMTREIFGAVNRISRAVRSTGGVNMFLRYTYDESEKQLWNIWYRNYMVEDQREMMKAAFSRGAAQWELMPDLEVRDGDLIVDKTRFSAMIPGTSDFDAMLKARGIETLIVTGTLTNCCCESTARDALQMGYNVIFMTDANATLTDEEHNATLMSMSAIFADVMDTPYLLGLIERSISTSAAA